MMLLPGSGPRNFWKWLGYVYLNDHMSGTQDVILGNCFVFELLHQNHNDIEYNTLT